MNASSSSWPPHERIHPLPPNRRRSTLSSPRSRRPGRQEAEEGRAAATRAARAVAVPARGGRSFRAPTLDCCPGCGGRLVRSRCEPQVLPQVEITETPTLVTEHQELASWCPHCRNVDYAPLPRAVDKAGLFGLRRASPGAKYRGRQGQGDGGAVMGRSFRQRRDHVPYRRRQSKAGKQWVNTDVLRAVRVVRGDDVRALSSNHVFTRARRGT